MIIRICAIVIILILIWKLLTRNHAYVEMDEYLDVLSFTEWKTVRQIKKDLQRIKGGYLNNREVIANLCKLEDEGLIERRVTVGGLDGTMTKKHEFRRKPGGRKEKLPDIIPEPVTCPA